LKTSGVALDVRIQPHKQSAIKIAKNPGSFEVFAANTMLVLAGGDKTVEIPSIHRKDEIGKMADAVQVFQDSMIKADQLAEELQATQYATTVATSAEEASTNVQTVASASEKLSSSISEISRQVAQSTQIFESAVDEVEGANIKVKGLADAANKIGKVTQTASETGQSSNEALNAANALSQQLETLRSEVATFFEGIKSS